MSEIDIQTKPLLEVKGLKKHFPIEQGIFTKKSSYVRAVDGVDLIVKQGETLGIVGESGCGKSTLGQLVLQLLDATEGEVWFNGTNLCGLNPKEMRRFRKDIQIIFQDPYSSINPRKTVEEIIAEPFKVHRICGNREMKERVAELLKVVGLGEHHMNRHPHEFSGGQRQRIGIARALALKPKLIVCDEPVSALDVSIQAQILNLLKQLQSDYQLTYVFIAHGLPAVKHISDRIAVMYLGKIVELADRDALFKSPKHPYTEALLSAVPIADPTKRKKRVILQGDLPSPVNPPSGCSFHTRCPYAQDICRTKVPALERQDDGHYAACHFPLRF
ncbi:dipeptide ABC transporter ATP-binding protein [Paenibacillus sp. LMG 31456]|uniref:Dipeptide ABC transporter ATP-binding protein n=1 Tax=Paenibacillus foliorum TaxID=2654974 RepID=A0A972K4N1_9BACL|nr:dipeptide ABC transporter ATP-binding protein [Paenibacillus foliorum]NOU96187.1 dipeptide ABC transporter ATP-binding protein [Paenibacillus foliorum]